MSTANYRMQLVSEAPAIVDQIDALTGSIWPEFMNHDTISAPLFGRLYRHFPQFQFALFDEHEQLTAMANTIPFAFDQPVEQLPNDGWRWAMQTGCAGLDSGTPPTMLSAIQICVKPEYRGKRIPEIMLRQMHELTRMHRLRALVAPVRPTLKSTYPLTPMEQYVAWKRPDGSFFDPWLRAHARMGARLISICTSAMVITGSIADWQSWTGMVFPESGDYIIPGALNPVQIDTANNTGSYVEPNVWMHHPLG